MLKVCIFLLFLWYAGSVVDTSVSISQSFASKGSEVSIEITRGFQWGKHLTRNIPLETTISSEVYFFGGNVEMKLKKITIDDSCHVSKCQSCNGTKLFDKDCESHSGHSMHIHKHVTYPCPSCLGLGITIDPGQRCQPHSSVYVSQDYFIPAGLFVNEVATLPREGNEIYENGERTTGSLLVGIKNIYSDREDIVIEAHCVHLIVRLTPTEALYGFTRRINLTDSFHTANIAVVDEEGDTKVEVTKDSVNGTMLVIDRTNLVTFTPQPFTLKSFVVFPHSLLNETELKSNSAKTQDLIVEFQLHSVETIQKEFLDRFGCILASTVSALCPPITDSGSLIINLDEDTTVVNQCETDLYQQYVYNMTVRGDEVLLCKKQQDDDGGTERRRNSSSDSEINNSRTVEGIPTVGGDPVLEGGDVKTPEWFDKEYAGDIGRQWNEMIAKDQLIRRMLFILKSRQSS